MQGRTITTKQWERFFEALIKHGGNITKACEETGISRYAYYVNRERDAKLMAQAKDALRAIYLPMAEMALLLALGRGDQTTARWTLQCLSSIWTPTEVTKIIGKIEQSPEIDEETKIALALWRKDYDKRHKIQTTKSGRRLLDRKRKPKRRKRKSN